MMGKKEPGAGMIVVAVLVLTFSAALSTPPKIDRQQLVEESDACLSCHEDYDVSLAGGAHRLSGGDDMKSPMAVGCTACHDGGEVHMEDPSKENISRPNNLLLVAQAAVCSRCHVTPHQQAMVTTDAHFRADVKCLDCHQIHDNSASMLVRDERQTFCLDCHTDISAEFQRRSNHPLESENIRCSDCHQLSGIENPTFAVGGNWQCQSCHSDYAGPFLYEHPVTYNHLVEGGGCVECHQPHGSSNDRLLSQPGNGTCQQCHGTPPGHRTSHSGLGAKLACVDCHSEVHGSYENHLFLDPELGTKLFPDCYQSGCHNLSN
ncbi:MAG: cytochrome c3 family protein [Candidatus Zixiibacteriota bacterium]